MKSRFTYILILFLSVFSVQTSMAQAKQDALYIFRNDGHFNAFFFGDIHHIEYSKVDTLGVEQDDYVVQEVYALDTLFRIPLSAIDSIAFVTPEKKYKADVFRPDKSIADYIVASDTINWIRLASNTPAAMIPKVGDKLLIEEESKYIPDGFVGLVTSVEKGDNGYTIMTGELSPFDVYDRFVIKAAAATPPQPGQIRRRGLIDGTEMSYTSEEPIELPVLSGSFTIQGSKVLYDKHDISLTADGAGAFGFSVAPRVQYRGFIFFDAGLGFQQDQNIIFFNKASYSLSLTGSLTGNVDVPIYGLPEIKLSDGLKIAVNCGLFINAQITGITVQIGWENEHISKNFYYQKVDPPFIYQDNEPVCKNKITFLRDTTTVSGSLQGKYVFSSGFYAKAELSASMPFKKTKYQDKVGARVEAGGRVSFEAPVWTPDIIADLVSSKNLYQLLNKETNISVSAYGKASLYAQIDDWVWSLTPELSTAPAHLYSLVPDINDIYASYDDPERLYRIKFTSPIRRDVLLGIPTGFVVLDQDKKVIDDWGGNYHFREKPGMTYDHVFTTLDPIKDDYKTYTVYPYIKYMDNQLLVDKSTDVKIDPARIDIEQRKLKVSEERGNREVRVQPNMAKVEFTPTDSWLETIWIDDKNELTVFWGELPKDMKGRKAKINIKGINSTTNETIITDTITVIQGEVSDASVEPTYLEFPTEGGAKAVKLNFGEYSLRGAAALSASAKKWLKRGWNVDYVEPKRRMNHYFITAAPNDTEAARTDTVRLFFTNDPEAPEESRYYIPVIVKQAAGPYNLQNVRKLFVGTWIGISYDSNNKPSWERRVIFYDDGTFNSQDRFVNSKTGEWGAWSKLEKQTYSVQSVETSAQYYKVYISLTGYSAGQFVEIYPHFMRHGGFYYEREDGTGDLWWKGRTRASVSIDMNEKSLVPLKDVSDVSLGFSDETE